MYVQPCCISKELPALVKGGTRFFQSNGDWTLQDMMSAVSCLVPKAAALVSLPETDVFLLRAFRTYLSRGWFRSLLLLTGSPQSDLVNEELSPVISGVSYASSHQVQDGVFALTDGSVFMVVQGPMLLEKDFSLCQYAVYYGVDKEVFFSAVEALTAKLHTSAFLRSEEELAKRILRKDI